MGISELLFGKAKGKTAYAHFRDYLTHRKEQQAFSLAFNPLNMRVGDFIDIYGPSAGNYQCESIFWYETDNDHSDVARYALKNTSSGDLQFLEAVPDNESYFYSLFELVNHVDWDTELINVIENEDILRHTEEDISIDYIKDFMVQSQLTVFSNSSPVVLSDVLTANYLFKDAKVERYLSVDLIPEQSSIAFYAGVKLQLSDFSAFGTAT